MLLTVVLVYGSWKEDGTMMHAPQEEILCVYEFVPGWDKQDYINKWNREHPGDLQADKVDIRPIHFIRSEDLKRANQRVAMGKL